MGSTTVSVAGLRHRFQAVALSDLKREPERGEGSVRFAQTTGGRTGLPARRQVRRRPYVQWQARLVWTTLSPALHADGNAQSAMTAASKFPRHWVYDGDGRLSEKSGLADFRDWYRKEYHEATLDLAVGADLLINDAYLFPDEFAAQPAFGHAAADYAVALGHRAGVGKVLLIHHSPDRTDHALEHLARRFKDAAEPVVVAAEGTVFDL